MKQDLLAEATRALRESEPASELEARATRTRVMSGLHHSRVRRRTRLAFLLPIAASFVAVSAWGAAGGRARHVLAELERLAGITTTRTRNSSQAPPRRLSAPPLVPTPSPEQAVVAPPRAAEPLPATPTVAPFAFVARATRSASSAPGRVERADPSLALYRVAHAAHFVERDPARALAAWDAYLSAAPNGEFAPEARYNRALSLVRLGRTAEAERALTPFANGAYGSYRKAEASALLARIAP